LTSGALGARHPEVQRLRALNRDPHARTTESAFVLEGPRLVDAALTRHAPLQAVYFAYRARPAFAPLLTRIDAAGIPTHDLREGVLEKIGVTRTPQPVLAVAARTTTALADVAATGDVLLTVDINNPGNLGTILRSAEAAGITAVVVTGDSVDAHNPKAVRASAGAVLGIPIVETPDPGATLDTLTDTGRRSVGTAARDGEPLDVLDRDEPLTLVLGNEAHGLDATVRGRLDTIVTIPMHGAAESLNVAMTATVLCFARDRHPPRRTDHERGAR
jgi:RNA methyltransferase, TrmH family